MGLPETTRGCQELSVMGEPRLLAGLSLCACRRATRSEIGTGRRHDDASDCDDASGGACVLTGFPPRHCWP